MWRTIIRSSLAVLALTAAPVAWAQSGPTPFPENLRSPQHNVLQLKSYASGVQVYACKAKADDPNMFEWTFKEPIAELWNERGEMIGKHFAGPTWEGNDGSKVVGMVVERANAPDRDAIPWLLLQTKSNAGTGVFTPVTYIQRLETVGGIAPTEGCDQATVNAERDVEYAATYLFYVWRGDVAQDQSDDVDGMRGVPSRDAMLAAARHDSSEEAR
ncbi:MAG TPA: DUF3455 domain-containing protein [Chloroflexota bacterium]|nr:DUF3455 domain-containing protein [Chloroflexota bacterium]